MKRILYLLVILSTIFMGCDPVQDIFDDLDAQDNPVVGSAEYTLVEDDYEDLGLDESYFTTIDEAKTKLPELLSDLYPIWGNGSSVLVGYELEAGTDIEGIADYTGADDYDLSMDDYALSGSDVLGFYPDVDPDDHVPDILDAAITAPEDGQIELARYIQFTEVPVISISTNYSLNDNLDYGETSGDLTFASDGEWEAHSAAGFGPVGYDAITTLSMTDYPSSDIGGSLTVDGSGSEDVTNWFTEIPSGTVYASALVDLSAVSTGTYTFHLRDNDFAVGYVARVGAMDDGFGKILFGIGASSSTLTYDTTAFDLDTTYLLVSSYNIGTGEANLYVLSTAEAMEPATPEATSNGNSGAIISGIAIRQGGGGPTGTFDGVRVATSWEAIMVNDVAELVEGDRMNTQIFYTFEDGDWETSDGVYFVQDADFDSMGEGSGQPGRFNNFSNSVAPENYMPTFLGGTSPFAFGQEGDELDVIYRFFDGGTFLKGNLYTVVNGQWEAHITQLQFGHDGTQWVPDNTIRYTFTSADVAFISNAFINIYPGPADNFGFFGSFDRRSSSSNYWSDEMLLEAFNALLDNNDPSAEEGQKYVLTYLIFNGSTIDESMSVIKTGGEWVLQ